ncbi:MAG: protein kinase [Myxococcales bacterium]|nr:protein kinase [Myxococcales bacterium]
MKIGEYELRYQLNKGGMAQVWLAQRVWPDGKTKVVAFKMPRTVVMADQRRTQMFLDEMRVAMQLEHDNIVSVFDAGIHKGLPWLAMSYVPGRNVAELLRAVVQGGSEFDFDVAAHITRELGYALQYAHGFEVDGKPQDIVHRDVAAKNVMISGSGGVLLTDFGVATAASIESTGQHVKGTFRYMAREHALGHASTKSDAFGMGTVLWSLVEGKDFRWDVPADGIVASAMDGYVTSLTREGVPPKLLEVIHGLLARDEADRWSVADAVEALEAFPGKRSVLKKMLSRFFGSEVLKSGHTAVNFQGSDELDKVMKIGLITGSDSEPIALGGLTGPSVQEADVRRTPRTADVSTPAAIRPPPAEERTERVSPQRWTGSPPGVPDTELLPVSGQQYTPQPGRAPSAPGPLDDPGGDARPSSEPMPSPALTGGLFEPSDEVRSPTSERLVPSPRLIVPHPRSRIAIAMIGLAVILGLTSAGGLLWIVMQEESAPLAQQGSSHTRDSSSHVAVGRPELETEDVRHRETAALDAAISPFLVPNHEPDDRLPPEARAAEMAEPTGPEPEHTDQIEPEVVEQNEPQPEPKVEPAPPPEPAPTPKKAAAPKVPVRIVLGFVPRADVRLGRHTHTLTRGGQDEITTMVPSGMRTLQWRQSSSDPWKRKTLDLAAGKDHFVRIDAGGPTHSATPMKGGAE